MYPTSSGSSVWISISDVVQTAVTVEIAPLHVRVGGRLKALISCGSPRILLLLQAQPWRIVLFLFQW